MHLKERERERERERDRQTDRQTDRQSRISQIYALFFVYYFLRFHGDRCNGNIAIFNILFLIHTKEKSKKLFPQWNILRTCLVFCQSKVGPWWCQRYIKIHIFSKYVPLRKKSKGLLDEKSKFTSPLGDTYLMQTWKERQM